MHLIINNGGQRHAVKHLIDSLPNAHAQTVLSVVIIGLIEKVQTLSESNHFNITTQPTLEILLFEAPNRLKFTDLVIAAQNEDVLRRNDLLSKQIANNLKTTLLF